MEVGSIMASQLIAKSCKVILDGLKTGQFSRQDLEFLLAFFKKIVSATEKMLKEG